jgi:hypothetical protein
MLSCLPAVSAETFLTFTAMPGIVCVVAARACSGTDSHAHNNLPPSTVWPWPDLEHSRRRIAPSVRKPWECFQRDIRLSSTSSRAVGFSLHMTMPCNHTRSATDANAIQYPDQPPMRMRSSTQISHRCECDPVPRFSGTKVMHFGIRSWQRSQVRRLW